MGELVEFEDYQEEDEEINMGSWVHSTTQSRLTTLLSNDERFVVPVELSLDVSQTELNQFGVKAKDELKPDVCLYPKEGQRPKRGDDILKMSEMPLLAIEILSPNQSISRLIAKIKAYFALGVKSCWLIIPANESITVYSASNRFKTFGTDATEVVDEVMDIRLPIQKIFSW